jgi:hypothetical protein
MQDRNLSMSMFATREDYLKARIEQLEKKNEKLQEANVMFLSEMEVFLPAIMKSYISQKPVDHYTYIRAKSFQEDIEWAKKNQEEKKPKASP